MCEEYQNENPRNKTKMAYEELQKAYDAHMQYIIGLSNDKGSTNTGQRMILENENLTDCDFFVGKCLKRAIFKNCILDRANFMHSKLENCDFSDNVLNMADFTGTQILNTCLDNCGLPLSSNIYGMIPDDRLVKHLLYCITKFQRDNMSEKTIRLIEQLENMRITGSLCDCSNEIETN